MALATKQSLKAAKLEELEEEQKQFEKRAAAKKTETAARKEADLPSAADSKKMSTGYTSKKPGTSYIENSIATQKAAGERYSETKKQQAAQQTAKRKEEDLPGYKPQKTISREEMFRLLNLDTKASENKLSEDKNNYYRTGGTAAAVAAGTSAGRNGKVNFDYSKSKADKEKINAAERDILLAKEIQKRAEWIKAQDSSEKMAEGREGFAAWEEDKKAKTEAEQKEKENESFWDFIFGAMGSSSDTTLGSQLEEVAIEGFREDTSYKEPNDEWTYEQKRTFGYFYGKGDIKAAEEYAIEVNNAINRKKKEETLESVTDAATRNALSEILASAGTVAASPLSSVDILTDIVEDIARGTVTEKADPSVFEMSQAVREAIGEDINRKGGTLGEEWGVLSGKGFGDLYQIGMSSADSLINAYAGGKAGALITAFGGSASGAVDDALSRGADADTALRYGLATGAAELFPEYLSIDSLFRLGSAKSLGGFLKNVGSQAASEGMEGAVTAISGALADDVIMGELSKFNTEVNAYIMDGYSREEAEQMAAKGGRIDIILDAVSEAIGGGMSGAAVTGANSAFGRNTLSGKTPVPFNGNAVTEEQKLVAEKIAEIENSSLNEIEKAEKMEEIAKAVAETTGSADVVAEAEKFKDLHRQKELDRATEVANRLGNVVEFDDTIIGNGIHQEDGTIIINPNSKNPVMQILVHELTHDIETSGLYGDFSQKILNYAAEVRRIDLAKMEQMVISDYAKAGQKLDKTLADREIVAKFAEEHLFTDEKAVERLCNTDPTLFDRIKYWISDMVARFRGTPEERFLRDAERLYEKALATRREVADIDSEEKSAGRGFDEMAAESISAEETKTPSMERAAPNLDVQYWTGIAEGIDMESGIWRMKDFARVLDGAAGENKELRQRLYDLYEKPLNEAQGTYAKNYATKVEGITEKFKELGIKAGSKESAAVQRIGEGVKEIDKNGNTAEYTLDDLKKEFPDSWKNIKAGADYCREIYDEFLNDLNAMYSEIYPATVEKANEQVSEYNARISLTADHIASYENVILELEKSKREKQQQLFKKKPDSLIYAELENQIANIDRKIDIATRRIEILKNRKLTKEISRDTLLAQIENGEILKNKQIKPRKDYFRHFQELTDEFAEIADIFSNDQRIPPNLAGKSADTKPRTIWTSIAQSRGKNYYTEDAVGGLLRYTEIAEKLLVYDPLISHFRDVNSAIRAAGVMVDNEVKGKGTNAGQFAAWADDITNQLAGKTNKIDRIVSDNFGALGRSGIKAIEALNRRVKSNAILGNVRSALVQIGNLPNASLYIQNPKDWANGVISMLNDNVKNDPLIQEGRNRSKFMNRRYMGDTIDELTKEIQQNKILDKPKEFALWMLGAGDKLSAELIWHTAYTRALRNPDVLSAESNKLRSYEDAVDYADDITRRSIGGRAEGDIPYFEESKITGLIAPFQIEVANTFNAFAEQGKKKNIAGLLAFEINVFLLNCVLEGITGDRPLGLDFIKVAWDIFNEATGDDEEEEEKEAWDIVTYGLGRILGETLSSMPFGTQIAEFLTGGDEQKAEKWFGDSDPTRYGTGNIGMGALADAADYFIEGETPEEFYRLATEGGTVGEWAEPVLEAVDTFAPLAMPWGGKQLSRSLRGIQQIAEGGAYGTDDDGKEYMKFPQVYDVESVIKTLLFGQYASDAGQRYIDSGFKDKLSAKQTEQMKEAAQFGISKDEFYETVLGLKPYKKEEEKQQALFENKILDSSEKSIVDWILFGDKNKPWELRDYSSEKAFYESGLEENELVLHEMGFDEKQIETGLEAVKKSDKKGEQIENLAEALNIDEQEAFEAVQKIEGNWIYSVKDLDEEEFARAEGARTLYGMSTDNYITVLNYSKYGAQVAKEDGTIEYSTDEKYVIPHIMEATGWNKELATEMYNRVHKYDYTRADLEEEQAKQLDTSAEWYGVEDKGYFTARNIIKIVEGEKDQYGKTVSGSKKEAAIKEIAEQLKIGTEEATIYYLAAIGAKNGGLALSVDDLSASHREDLKTAIERGWTERQYLDAVNIIKLSGADSKDEIIKALTDAGASYSMAQGYYNLRQNKDYNKAAYFAYGMKNEKQVTKADYFMKNYGKGSVTAKDVTAWYKAASGCKKKQEYIDAYKSAGATQDQAVKFYNLMRGYDKAFNAWYKENGG